MTELTLLVPGLLDALRQQSGRDRRFPALARLLARGDRSAASCDRHDELLLQLFGVEWGAEDDAPIAPVSLLGDGGEPGDGYWLRADPVHLQADQDRLLLVSAEQLAITPDEAQSWCAALNAHFGADGLTFSCLHPTRWYLRWDAAPRVQTTPLEVVAGRNVHAHLPTGPAAPRWRALLNEVQMLLHGSEPNQARAARAAPLINSLWFFGAGRLPRSCVSAFDAVHGDTALLRGLAACAATPCTAPPADAGAWLRGGARGSHLLDLSASASAEAFEQGWAAPLWRALRRRRLQRLRLWPGGDHWLVARPAHTWRFWRSEPTGS